jgi:hypothetical protein
MGANSLTGGEPVLLIAPSVLPTPIYAMPSSYFVCQCSIGDLIRIASKPVIQLSLVAVVAGCG